MEIKSFERIIAIPIFKDDSYHEIAARFLDEYDDDDVLDGFYAEMEARNGSKVFKSLKKNAKRKAK